MNKQIYIALTLVFLSVLSCGSSSSSSDPKAAISPIALSNDLTTLDVCRAIPIEDLEAVLGRKLAAAPKSFQYYDTAGASGCWYDAGKDANGAAHFGYVVLTPVSVYNSQPLYQNVEVNGLGVSAYFNNGADARQLWVKVNETVAFVVAFGDQPNESGSQALAKLLLAAIK